MKINSGRSNKLNKHLNRGQWAHKERKIKNQRSTDKFS